ncbi:MAG: nucleotidyl transferase AbiEii/AbiGii toxin family protein [Spirochaetota bacterium]|nr:nucleotidyl transferase AbiEii/AbiGii toxin family protein [Spirochaetota bacterium]
MKNLNLPFYLTGGTALSRGYFNHRYSDDIDLFTNNNPHFRMQAKNIIDSLVDNGYTIDNGTITTSQDYISFIITHENFNVQLKMDLVNDVAPHFGSIQPTPVYYRTDDWYNILINKITAILRLEIKDFVDIWIIAKHKSFNWDEALNNAREKELGLDPVMIAKLLKTVPLDAFTKIKWITQYSFDKFNNDMDLLVNDLLKGNNNSLCI